MRVLLPLLGNQLFPLARHEALAGARVLMVEDRALCRTVRHHQQKLVLVLAAMRAHADALRAAGVEVVYHRLDAPDNPGLWAALEAELSRTPGAVLRHFTVHGRATRRRLHALAARLGVVREELDSPLFLTSLDEFDAHLGAQRKPLLARFYRQVRTRHGILLEADGRPRGGRWSFDADNRRALPRDVQPPSWPSVAPAQGHVAACIELVAREFPDHPGDARAFAWPTTRAGALAWLEDFLAQRCAAFGSYQDAISRRSDSLYHSLLSPLLNIGLLTPREVLDRTLAHAERTPVPINSLEGFVRQLLGWREFVRGVHERFGAAQASANFWRHERAPATTWMTGETGIPPLDDAIRLALARGWNHHIQRLMVLGNLMLLSELAPRHAYRWFMEMYVDAYAWVMEPNVYGMALYSDGGLFATKPYVCASSYLLRMSDYRPGPWCDVVDGLYWSFIERHRGFFASQPRLRVTVGNLDRMPAARRARIFAAARAFRDTHTRAG